jgi:hypothetical protein
MKTKLLPGCTAIVLLLSTPLNAQFDDPKEERPNLYTGISAVVLPKDATEVNLLNSLSSFWIALSGYDAGSGSSAVLNRVRYSRADHVLRVSHGFAASGRWDLGADFYYTRVRFDDRAQSSPFRVYSAPETPEGQTFSGLSAIGLQARVVPFAGLPELTLRTGLVYPLARTEDLRARLNAERMQLFLTAVYLNRLGPSTLALVQGDFRTLLRNSENDATLLLPSATGYLVFELFGDRWYAFPGLSYNVALQQFAEGYPFRAASKQLYGSLGVMFRPSDVVSVLVSAQTPFIFDSGSARAEWVRESYFGWNLGLRFLL